MPQPPSHLQPSAMPQPPSHPQLSPQHHAYQQQAHVHRPPPPALSSPVYAPGEDVVPQVLC
ncbi:hypothetical protein BDR03DRAFT_965100 [Suillus americanus]|nr:hypothetical protein BDR03DRAFT_965100 [Suillus americanus]